jgi:hypothetical protein
MRPMLDRRTRVAGVSILELAIMITIASVIAVTIGQNFLDFSRAFSSLTTLIHGKTRAQVVMNRLVEEMTTGSFTTLAPAVPIASDFVEFQRVTGVVDGEPVLGNPIHIDLVPMEKNPGDGLDDDGNGLADDCGIRIWEDFPPYGPVPANPDQPVIICSKIQKGGLQFTRDGAILLIDMVALELVERGKPPTVVHLRSGVKMRNK